MLALDPRAARYTWTVAFIVLLLGFVYLIREALFIFVVALLFACLLWPLVDFLNRRIPGRSRVPALAIVYCLLIALLIIVGIAVGSRVVLEANSLATKGPEFISKLEQPDASPPVATAPVATAKSAVASILRKQFANHSKDLLSLLPNAALRVLSHAGSLVFIVLVPILSFFFLKDGPAILEEMLDGLGDDSRRSMVEEIAADLHLLLARYMRALVMLAAASFAANGLFLFLIGVPYALLLAAMAFPMEFIPMVGPFVAAVIILTVAGLSGFHHLLWVLAFLCAYRLFQDYVLSPHLLSAGMEIPPLIVIFGVLAGGRLAGIPGILLSVPVLATLRIVYRQLQKRHREMKLLAPDLAR